MASARRAAGILVLAGFLIAALGGGARGGEATTEEVERCPRPRKLSEEERFARARDHYQRGLILYEQGDYEAAIDEFILTYCYRDRYPGYFYDIGQAFERLLLYDKAVAYFERFVREAEGLPKEELNLRKAAIRIEVLKKLPARITVATEPPAAEVTLRSSGSVIARGESGSGEPLLATRGVYTMRVEAPGHQMITREIEVEIGQPYSYYLRLSKLRGTLKINVSPDSARIFLDRELIAEGSMERSLSIGSYEVLIEAPGREPVNETVEVTAGKTTELDLSLPEPPRSGRTELIIGSTLVLGATSASTLVATTDDATLASLGALGGLGLGFVGSWFGVPDDIPAAHSSYLIGSAAVGATEGFLIGNYLCELRGGEDPPVGGEPATDNCAGDSSGGGAIGATGGVLFSVLTVRRFDLSAGDVALVHSGAIWGTATGILFASLFEDAEGRVAEPLTLAGLNLGLVAGALLSPHIEISRGRSALIDLGGLGGLVVGFAAANAGESGIAEQQAHFALVGMGSGLITAAFLTRNMDRPGRRLGRVSPALGAVRGKDGSMAPSIGARLQF